MGEHALVNAEVPRIGEPVSLAALRARIADRFGLVPAFFMMAHAEPPIVESMFSLVEFAYFDSPLPALFKERLFVYVSRFCAVPYCMPATAAFSSAVAMSPGTRMPRVFRCRMQWRCSRRHFPTRRDGMSYSALCAPSLTLWSAGPTRPRR